MAVVETKVEKTSAESVPAANPPTPEPEFHVTFVHTALPPVSLFRQIRDKLREPKNPVPKFFPPSKGSPVPGAEFHATFVDTTLAPVSLFRQIRQRFREPKVVLKSEYYRRGAGGGPDGNSVVSGGEFHATFVERTLPPVSLFRQIAEGLHEPKTPAPIRPGHITLPPQETPVYVEEDPNQLNLFARPETPIEPKPVKLPEGWQDYHVVMVVDPEVVKWRRRTMYLSSLILHGILVLLLVFSPDLLRRGRMMIGLPVEVAPQKQYSFLVLPPDVLRKLTQPPPENSPLSDRDRRAQGRSPVIVPKGLPMPYSRGNTPLPEIAGGKPPAAAPAPPPAAGGNPAPAAPGQPAHQAPSPESQPQAANNDGLRLEDAKPPSAGGQGLNLPNLTPGQSIQQSLQSAARGRSMGGGVGNGSGYGEGNGQFENLQPNFSTEGPLILSDTRGVDFGPYLARVIYIVRRNWYSMIPESARLGEKGRVGIVFEILKDGTVPQIRLVASSGADPLDRAALGSIRASSFPPLPDEFTGNHLVLQFIFLYNLSPGQ